MPARDGAHPPGAGPHGLDRLSASRGPSLRPFGKDAQQDIEGTAVSSTGAARCRAWVHPSRNEAQAIVRERHAARHAGTVRSTWCIGLNKLGRQSALAEGKRRRNMATQKRIVSLPASGGEAGLNRYLAEIKKFPILSPEEEYMLAKRWREHGDTEAAAKLVNSHLRLVAKIAMGYRGYGLPVSELISEGNIGLMQGVKKFEPDRGFRVATYAMWWIRASIQEFILRSWSLVKMGTTAAQKKLFFNLRRMKNQIDAFEEGDLKPQDVTKIATDLGVTEDEVISMNRRMGMGGDTSLNVSLKGDEGGESQWQDFLVDSGPLQDERIAEDEETRVRHDLLMTALESLNDREKHILMERRLADEPKTLEELSQVYGVSRERIRQIEVRAFEKLQAALLRLAGEKRLLPAA